MATIPNQSIDRWTSRLGDGEFDPSTLEREVVVEVKSGKPRQAGADSADGQWIVETRRHAEESLYVFAKLILGLNRMTDHLHLGVCNWLQQVPPYRKLYLLPRDHLKTSIARSLILHLLIQPKEHNVYFQGCWEDGCGLADCVDVHHRFDGSNTRILYAGETERAAQNQLRWCAAKMQSTKLLRALWPHRMWDDARKEAPKWSAEAFQVRRTKEYPEASVEALGVGGAVTGRHYDVLVKDDIATMKAANSRLVMEDTIAWNTATRALMDDPDKSLEFMLGTRWAPGDVWRTIQQDDPTVQVMCRAILEDGKPIFPEMFSLETIDRLRREEGSLFPLMRMNTDCDPSLSDFDMSLVRDVLIDGTDLVFNEDSRDAALAVHRDAPLETETPGVTVSQEFRGQRFREAYDTLGARNSYLRLRA
jgi:hypothetical protein